ncbi:MAG: hypothetical protein V3T20_06665 [Gemmatimonadota bacterium]
MRRLIPSFRARALLLMWPDQASGAASEAGDQVMTADDWLEVELPNDSRGWLQRASVK